MKLRTPVTGTTIDVADEKAPSYIAQGFQPIEEQPKPAKKPAAKKKGK